MSKGKLNGLTDEPLISREEMLKKTADEIAEIANRNSSGYSEHSNWRTNKRTALAIYDDYKKGKLSFDNGYFVPSVPVEPKFKVGDRVKSLTYKDAFGNDIATITKVHLLKFGTVVRYDLHFDDYGNVRGFYEQDLMLLEDEPQPTAQSDDEEEMLEIEAEALQLAIKLKLALLDKAEPQADSQYPQRNGNVTANDLKATFGFRYVNVDINLDEKQEQQMLNVSYDTFRLLAQIIGKPMIAIGLGRNLTLNIGIKRMDFGTGGCYSLQYKALNFKSLDDYKHIAHEWLHALDHYLYYTYGTMIPEKPYIMQSTRMLWRPIARNEIRNAFYEVNALIMRSDYQKRSEEVATAAHDKYWIDNAEKLARAFEVWTDAKMRAIGEHNNHLVSMFPNNPYPDFSNPKDAPISAAFDALFAAFRMEKYPYDIESLR